MKRKFITPERHTEKMKELITTILERIDVKGRFKVEALRSNYRHEFYVLLDRGYLVDIRKGMYHLAKLPTESEFVEFGKLANQRREDYLESERKRIKEAEDYLASMAKSEVIQKEIPLVKNPPEESKPNGPEVTVPGPVTKTTKYKIFGITFTKTEMIQ